jgi:hypothetical protein
LNPFDSSSHDGDELVACEDELRYEVGIEDSVEACVSQLAEALVFRRMTPPSTRDEGRKSPGSKRSSGA